MTYDVILSRLETIIHRPTVARSAIDDCLDDLAVLVHSDARALDHTTRRLATMAVGAHRKARYLAPRFAAFVCELRAMEHDDLAPQVSLAS